MPRLDFKCENGHVEEELFRASETVPDEMPCRVCGEPAAKQFPLVGVSVVGGTPIHHPGWARK